MVKLKGSYELKDKANLTKRQILAIVEIKQPNRIKHRRNR